MLKLWKLGRNLLTLLVIEVFFSATSMAAEWFVAAGSNGNGTSTSPFGTIQAGLNAARAGDIVTVRPGTYAEALVTKFSGTSSARITVRSANGRGSVLITKASRLLTPNHAYNTFEGLIFDAQYAFADIISVGNGADFLVLRNCEVRRTTLDCIDIGNADGILIEGCLIHHALNSAGTTGRTDAHGIVAGVVHDLVIRNTEIHTFSGDAFQADPDREAPGWDRVTIEGCNFWLAPFAVAEAGFAAGTVPGENAVDTKTYDTGTRANLTIRNTRASGFGKGIIGNMAAFNLKENINAMLENVTVSNSQIAFRCRGPSSRPYGAWVTVKNAVVHGCEMGVRYEDNVETIKLWNCTFGAGNLKAFVSASAGSGCFDFKNFLMLGTLPSFAVGPSNLGVNSSVFVNAAAHDYHLVAGSSPVDKGITIAGLTTDRDGVSRPKGAAYDIGAYEYAAPAAADVTAPTLAVVPADYTYVIASPITLTGTASDTSGVQNVTVNTSATTTTDNYANWTSGSFALAAGTNAFTVVATDKAATPNSATKLVRIIYATGTFDGNKDGVPDVWQVQNFGPNFLTNPMSLGTADADGDGLSNWAEYRAGTSPLNQASSLRVTSQGFSGGNAWITWLSVPGKSYDVEYSTNLTTWTFGETIAGSTINATTTWTDTSSAGQTKKFYRIKVR
jgi:hypothetical protein